MELADVLQACRLKMRYNNWMIGSTVVHAPDEQRLLALEGNYALIAGFARVELDVLTGAELTLMLPTGVRWSAGAPVIYDEEGGLAITHVSAAALRYLVANKSSMTLDAEQRRDLDKICDFLGARPLDEIYEVTSF
jgi:hypothetical protein